MYINTLNNDDLLACVAIFDYRSLSLSSTAHRFVQRVVNLTQSAGKFA